MSEPAQAQGGGGEGPAPTPSPQQSAPETVQKAPEVVQVDVKTEQPAELNPVVNKVESQTDAKVENGPAKTPEVQTEVKTEQPAEIKEAAPVEEPVKVEQQTEKKVDEKVQNGEPAKTEGWQEREKELLKKINELEKVKNERTEDGLRLELKVKEEEIDLLKARVKNLETELQAALSKPGGKNQEIINNIKQQHEELLSKARGMIFDKTKMVKNQELQIEALTTQVASLKDINQITKDLLEIRNSEVKAMEDRFQAMEARYKAEKERYDLVLKRAHTSTSLNDDLKKEYETQLAIFKELREKYEQRVKALVAENERLKAGQGGTST